MDTNIKNFEKISFDKLKLQNEQDKIIAKFYRMYHRNRLGVISQKDYEKSMDLISEKIDDILSRKGLDYKEAKDINIYRTLIRGSKIEELLKILATRVSKKKIKLEVERIKEKYKRLEHLSTMGTISFNEYEDRIETIVDFLNQVVQEI